MPSTVCFAIVVLVSIRYSMNQLVLSVMQCEQPEEGGMSSHCQSCIQCQAVIGWLAAVLLAVLASGPVFGQITSEAIAPFAAEMDVAVTRGLDFLVSEQLPDRSFGGAYGREPGVVALVGMAFLAAGHTPGRGPYGDFINQCIDYCLDTQREDGYIAIDSGRGMYSHTIASLFLSEVSGMVDPVRQQRLDEALPKTLDIIISAQNMPKGEDHRGGWRYYVHSRDSDLSCSGWALMALRSARLNGARVPDENIDQAVEYVLRMQHDSTGGFRYRVDRDSNISLTGLAVLCLELTGFHGSPEVQRAMAYITSHFRRIEGDRHWEYALYYNAQATFQHGGNSWESFAQWMYTHYLPQQRDDGSWPRHGGSWSREVKAAEVFTTAMVVLSFTVPYRQLPIYQRDETVDDGL